MTTRVLMRLSVNLNYQQYEHQHR